MRLPIQVEGIVFSIKDGEPSYLLLRRTDERGGFWQPITGGYEEEDGSLLDACIREVEEETGISPEQTLTVISDVHRFQFSSEGGVVRTEYVFGFEVIPETPVYIESNEVAEHDEYRWALLPEALELLTHETNKTAFLKLDAIIKKKD